MQQIYLLGITPPNARRGGTAPVVAGPYPGASAPLGAVLASITSLTPADQRNLARAFKAAEVARRPAKPKLLGQRRTFAGYDDFMPAFYAAREAVACRAGRQWYLNPDVAMKARVPAAWVACRVSRGTINGPRDVNFPRAEFWPEGVLPVGPEYAEFGPIAPVGDVRLMDAQRAEAVVKFKGAYPGWYAEMLPQDQPAFDLEHTPDGEMDTSMLNPKPAPDGEPDTSMLEAA
jgi:hypothetical protein